MASASGPTTTSSDSIAGALECQKNGFELKEILEALGQLPEGTRMFTMDATAMYTNIETDHGLEIIEKFFELFKDQLPDRFPRELILLALRLIMKNNVFELGTTYFKQLNGTAMGTPPACMYATIYYAVDEILRLLKNMKSSYSTTSAGSTTGPFSGTTVAIPSPTTAFERMPMTLGSYNGRLKIGEKRSIFGLDDQNQ
ncbi:hypothetical protein ACHAWF_000566 [Thalassiosira exigua]